MNCAPIQAIEAAIDRKKSLLAHEDGLALAFCTGPHAEDYAARLALCWNACCGVPTAELLALQDDGGVASLLDVLDDALAGGERRTIVEASEPVPVGAASADGPFID